MYFLSKVLDAVSESPNVLQPSAPYERSKPVVALVKENHPKIQLFFLVKSPMSLMDFCHFFMMIVQFTTTTGYVLRHYIS